MSLSKFVKKLVLIILPILLLVITLELKNHNGPYWVGSSDPEYAYLLNSLNLTQLKEVGHIDHPGTPLQILGAVVIASAHLGHNDEDLVIDVLKNPELYLNDISYTIVFLIVVSMFLVGLLTLLLTGSLMYALIIQMSPFLSVNLLLSMYHVSPEPLLLLVELWFSYLLLHTIYPKDNNHSPNIIFLGIISGLLIATKINSTPLVVLPIIFLPFKRKIKYLLVTFIAFIGFTLPIYKQYRLFFEWVYRLALNNGLYGTGASTIIYPQSFIQNIIIIIKDEKFLSLSVFIIFVLLIILFKKRKKINVYKYLFGLLLLFCFEILLVAKHFHMHYLIPALALIGLSLVIILSLVRIKLIKYITFICILGFAVNTVYRALCDSRSSEERYKEATNINYLVNSTYSHALKINYYGSSSIEYALSFGNDFALNNYGEQLSKIYPNSYIYEIWKGKYYIWGEEVILPFSETKIFRGSPLVSNNLKYKPKIKLEDIYGGKFETLYRAME